MEKGAVWTGLFVPVVEKVVQPILCYVVIAAELIAVVLRHTRQAPVCTLRQLCEGPELPVCEALALSARGPPVVVCQISPAPDMNRARNDDTSSFSTEEQIDASDNFW